MLPIKLNVTEEFLKEENRNGCTVTKETKEVWAVELDLLNELMRLCKDNDLKVFAGYGTLIGACRHDGFIPWDDDIDVMMFREDYEKLIKIGGFEEPYFLQTEKTDIGFSRAFARLRNSKTTCIQTSEKDMDIPYNQGVFIDIFPIDYMPDNKDERMTFGKKMRKWRDNAMKFSTFVFRAPNGGGTASAKDRVKHCISKGSRPIMNGLGINNPYIKKIWKAAEGRGKTGKIGDYWFYDPFKDQHCYDTQDFDKIKNHKFEMIEIPIPSGYDNILTTSFGEWRTPVMDSTDHGNLIIDCHVPYDEYIENQKHRHS